MPLRQSAYVSEGALGRCGTWPWPTYGSKIAYGKKDVYLVKVLGADNPADLLTKNLDRPTMQKHMDKLGLKVEEGRAGSAPSIEH